MAAWHRSLRADLGLRATGLCSCAVSYAATARLCALYVPAHTSDASALALATIGFLGASAGSAMLLLGHHLFDEIEVGERWRRSSPRTIGDALQSAVRTIMDQSNAEPLVVGKDADGTWTVRESAGLLLGRFATAEVAQHFARRERYHRRAASIAPAAGMRPRLEGRLTLRDRRLAPVGHGNA